MAKRYILIALLITAPAGVALACGGGTKSLNQTASAIFNLESGRAILEHLGGVTSAVGVSTSAVFGYVYQVSEFASRQENIAPVTAVQTNIRQSLKDRDDSTATATSQNPKTRAEYSLHAIAREFNGL